MKLVVFLDGRLDVLGRVEDLDWAGQRRLEDHDPLGWLGHHVSGVGIERFQVPAATG